MKHPIDIVFKNICDHLVSLDLTENQWLEKDFEEFNQEPYRCFFSADEEEPSLSRFLFERKMWDWIYKAELSLNEVIDISAGKMTEVKMTGSCLIEPHEKGWTQIEMSRELLEISIDQALNMFIENCDIDKTEKVQELIKSITENLASSNKVWVNGPPNKEKL